MHTLLRRNRGVILIASVVAAAAASFAAAASTSPSTPASTTLSPAPPSSAALQYANANLVSQPVCAPQSPTCNPTHYTPPVYQEAVGFGDTEDTAHDAADNEAAQVCGLRGWTRVKGMPEDLGVRYKYTLTYTCG